jgi:hypothetical protein
MSPSSSFSSSYSRFFVLLFCISFLLSSFPASVLSKERRETTEQSAKDKIGVGSQAIGQQLHQWVFAFSSRFFDIANTFVYYQSAFDIGSDLNYVDLHQVDFLTYDQPLNSTWRKRVCYFLLRAFSSSSFFPDFSSLFGSPLLRSFVS